MIRCYRRSCSIALLWHFIRFAKLAVSAMSSVHATPRIRVLARKGYSGLRPGVTCWRGGRDAYALQVLRSPHPDCRNYCTADRSQCSPVSIWASARAAARW